MDHCVIMAGNDSPSRYFHLRAWFPRAVRVFFACLLTSLMCGACSAPVKGVFPPEQGAPSKAVYLVRHGLHVGIVLKRADVPAGVWPQRAEFPEADYLEVGWGDRDYYQSPDPGLGTLLKAGLLPTASVLHIVGFNGPVPRYFPRSEIVRLDLSLTGFARLGAYIEGSYAKDARGAVQVLGPGLYGDSRFYLSAETYHAFNTCNVWSARGLRAAGLPFSPPFMLTVDSIMSRAAAFGTVIQRRPTPP